MMLKIHPLEIYEKFNNIYCHVPIQVFVIILVGSNNLCRTYSLGTHTYTYIFVLILGIFKCIQVGLQDTISSFYFYHRLH